MTQYRLDDLPAVLLPYQDKILATAQPSILLHLCHAEDLPLWQSKVGGKPYLPLNMPYPENNQGQALQLVAQINFAELPENTIYPKQGILQFYIDAEDDLLGLNFDDQTDQTGFRVIYHQEVIQDLKALHHFEEEQQLPDFAYSNLTGEYSIYFELTQQYMGIDDFKFERLIFDDQPIDDQKDELLYDEFYEAYHQHCSASGHRLGGYPFFTQGDPREIEEYKDYILLFQLDSESNQEKNIEIIWGDAGVGNFFIKAEDLKNLDFSKVMYNWDCY